MTRFKILSAGEGRSSPSCLYRVTLEEQPTAENGARPWVFDNLVVWAWGTPSASTNV